MCLLFKLPGKIQQQLAEAPVPGPVPDGADQQRPSLFSAPNKVDVHHYSTIQSFTDNLSAYIKKLTASHPSNNFISIIQLSIRR